MQLWWDNWLTRDSSCKVQSPISIMLSNALVIDLINTQSAWWNLDLVQSILTELDTKEFLKLRVSMFPMEDKLIWTSTTHGVFFY